MKTIKPDFFDNFVCIASKCKDSCCQTDWQIDVDDSTMQKYSFCDDGYVSEILDNITVKERQHCIKLKNGVCPFLNNEKLCDIILKKGDRFLNEVCKTYPRFFNLQNNVKELGLGLGCEEASRLLLCHKDKIYFVDENNKIMLLNCNGDERQILFDIVQNRLLETDKRILQLLQYKKLDANFDFEKLKLVFMNFEFLNAGSKGKFLSALSEKFEKHKLQDFELENLLVYFLYRYYNFSKKYEVDQSKILKFCIFSALMCDKIVSDESDLQSKIIAITTFSKEIENDENNIKIIVKNL